MFLWLKSLTVERCDILCRRPDRAPNHATDCNCGHFDPSQQSLVLVYSRYAISLECMARAYSWTVLLRPAFVAVGICHLCGTVARLCSSAVDDSVVEC